MKIYGLMKLTLLDFPEKTACTVFTGGCNFRCPFCHNGPLVNLTDPPLMDEEEFFSFLDKRKGLLEGVCITGGEPLMQPDIIPFMQKIKEKGFAVKLDTNGSFPEKLREAIESGVVSYVAMDIKTSLKNYEKITLVPTDTDKIKESVNILKEGAVPYEFRTTVTKELHTAQDIEDIANLIEGADRYFLQTYKETENVLSYGNSAPESAVMADFAQIAAKKVKFVKVR